jgi:hypothetical protein
MIRLTLLNGKHWYVNPDHIVGIKSGHKYGSAIESDHQTGIEHTIDVTQVQESPEVAIVFKPKVVGSYDRVICPHCGLDFQHGQRVEMPMPYCENCGKIVFDITQRFCCWCGSKFENRAVTEE